MFVYFHVIRSDKQVSIGFVFIGLEFKFVFRSTGGYWHQTIHIWIIKPDILLHAWKHTALPPKKQHKNVNSDTCLFLPLHGKKSKSFGSQDPPGQARRLASPGEKGCPCQSQRGPAKPDAPWRALRWMWRSAQLKGSHLEEIVTTNGAMKFAWAYYDDSRDALSMRCFIWGCLFTLVCWGWCCGKRPSEALDGPSLRCRWVCATIACTATTLIFVSLAMRSGLKESYIIMRPLH